VAAHWPNGSVSFLGCAKACRAGREVVDGPILSIKVIPAAENRPGHCQGEGSTGERGQNWCGILRCRIH
jgi:hypothetical protein